MYSESSVDEVEGPADVVENPADVDRALLM